MKQIDLDSQVVSGTEHIMTILTTVIFIIFLVSLWRTLRGFFILKMIRKNADNKEFTKKIISKLNASAKNDFVMFSPVMVLCLLALIYRFM